MNKYHKILCMLLFFLTGQVAYSQEREPFIEVVIPGEVTMHIANNSSFNFKGADGNKYKGKIYIYNDSQFAFYNYFNELGTDTFNIYFVDYVNLIGEPERYRIRPGLLVLGIIAYPLWPITVPIFVYKLVATKREHRWVGRDEFTIKIGYENPKE